MFPKWSLHLLIAGFSLQHALADDPICPKDGKFSDAFGLMITDHIFVREWDYTTPRGGLNLFGPDNLRHISSRTCDSGLWNFTVNIFEPNDGWKDARPVKVVPCAVDGYVLSGKDEWVFAFDSPPYANISEPNSNLRVRCGNDLVGAKKT